MTLSSLRIVDLARESPPSAAYDNHSIATVNDHEVRISTMTEPYPWHCHPDSDETFLVLEGGLIIETDAETLTLRPGQMLTVPAGLRHCTRPAGSRSVNITFERSGTNTTLLP